MPYLSCIDRNIEDETYSWPPEFRLPSSQKDDARFHTFGVFARADQNDNKLLFSFAFSGLTPRIDDKEKNDVDGNTFVLCSITSIIVCLFSAAHLPVHPS